MKGKPRVNTKIPFKAMSVSSREVKEIRFIDAFKWRWIVGEDQGWHVSFVIDFSTDKGRFIIYQCAGLDATGITGERCDEALDYLRGALNSERRNTSYEVHEQIEFESAEIEVPELIPEGQMEISGYNDGKYFRDLMYEKTLPPGTKTITPLFKVKIERYRERYRQMSLFDLTEQI